MTRDAWGATSSRKAASARPQRGSASGERLILLAVAALVVTLLVVTYSRSPAAAFAITGVSFGAGLLVFGFGYFRDRRRERGRVERCRRALEEAAAAQQAALDASFYGAAQAGPAAFGVAGAARKLYYARHDWKVFLETLDFGQLTAAFARPDGAGRYRLEVRTRPGDAPPAAYFLTTGRREEAERWVRVLEPHLGPRAKMVEAEGMRDEG
ncbi:MAG TPA: hypothetical protein VMN03_04460 [Burkholderiales bacterium]|nr:hypothetical protein [Burkholderiales bacterium]